MATWKEPKNDYTAESQVVPEIFNTLAENERYLQEVKITTEQVQDAIVTSTQSSMRTNLLDSESVKDAFGKIRKWLADLGSLAFKSIVETADIAASAVTEVKIASGAVTTEKIADGAVTDAKIDSVLASKVTGLAKVGTSGDYNDLSNKPEISAGVNVIDNLTSTSRTDALSAYQGKVLNDRLNELGFKEGVATYTGTSMNANVVNSLQKCGKFVIFNFGVLITAASRPLTITIPEGFRPKSEVKVPCRMYPSENSYTQAETITIPPSGVFTGIGEQVAYILNAGWEVS